MSGAEKAFEAAKATLTGDRSCNQDRCLVLSSGETLLLGLADGLGGHPRGEVAAQLLIDVCEAMFRQAQKPLHDPELFMLQCIGRAHHAILRYGGRQQPPIAPRTTAVLAIVQRGIAHWAHVGDSRLYLIRDAQVHAQTRDHAQVRFIRQRADEASRPRASLTRCLGGMAKPPTTTCSPPTVLQAGDILVLCSDGLWGQLPTQELILGLSGESGTIGGRLDKLVDQAATTPNSDNVTAVALRWLAPPVSCGDDAVLLEPASDPQLEEAIAHLNNMLEKSGEQQR